MGQVAGLAMIPFISHGEVRAIMRLVRRRLRYNGGQVLP